MNAPLNRPLDVPAAPLKRATRHADLRADATAALVILALTAIAWFSFPDDLAFASRVIATILFVLSLDLVTGYCGVATLGHSILFGAGAYAAGIANVHGVAEPLLLLGLGALAGAVAGVLSGALIVRYHGLPQLVLSIALVQLAGALANKASSITGGSDGLAGIEPGPVLDLFAFDLYARTAYLFGAALLLVVFVALLRLVRSPFGLICRGIKEDPLRVRAMGGRIVPTLVRMYAISGFVAGLAGALAAIGTGVVGLDSLSFERSAEALVMLVLGGTGSLYGALIGTLLFQLFEHLVSAANPFHWLTMVGALLVAVVLFLPGGLHGAGDAVRRLIEGRRAP